MGRRVRSAWWLAGLMFVACGGEGAPPTSDASPNSDGSSLTDSDVADAAPPDAIPDAPITVTITNPPPSTVEQGASYTFEANTPVTWSLSAVACGTVDASTGDYTGASAPASSCVLTATSTLDTSKSATAMFNVPAITIMVSPATGLVAPLGNVGFTATVVGAADKTVTWSITSGSGTINEQGIYYAPVSTGSATVKATSVADNTKTATGTATTTNTVTVAVAPKTVTLNQGGTQSFAATVTGNNNHNVTWSVTGGSANGTIDASGLYTAPMTNGTYTVVATSVADTGKSDSATITVNATPQIVVTISPASTTLAPGGQTTFSATVTGTSTQTVTYSVLEGAAGGTVASDGSYTAPSGPGVYHVVATSTVDTSKTATAAVTVSTGPSIVVTISPTTATLALSGTQTFTAQVFNSLNTGVLWSASCGTIDSSGHYTAPDAANTCTVTATSAADATRAANATVTVTDMVGVTVSPATITVIKGNTQTFTAAVTGSSNTAVTWSIVSQPMNTGSINASTGVYDSSAASAATPFTLTVRATSQADNLKYGTATLTVVASSLHTVSGTISYSGAATIGRVYVDVLEEGSNLLVGGTSRVGVGSYTIRCLRYAKNLRVQAWSDQTGYGAQSYAADPGGQTSFSYDGMNDVNSINVALTDPTLTVPGAPTFDGALPTDTGAVVLFRPVTDGNQHSLAEHYNVYVSNTANPGPMNNILVRQIGGFTDTNAFLSGLTNGLDYYVGISAVNKLGEGPVGQLGSKFTPNPAMGGSTVSGTVDLGDFVPTGPMFVVAVINEHDRFATIVYDPMGTVSYSIQGVSSGPAQVVVFIDQLGDSMIAQLDPQLRSVPFMVSGNGTAPPITLLKGAVLPTVTTTHVLDASGGGSPMEGYNIDLSITAVTRIPVKAQLLAGAGLGTTIPYDIGLFPDVTRSASYSLRFFQVTGPLAMNDTYSILLTYADGSTEVVEAVVTGSLPVATGLTPSTVGVGTMPMFNWTAPNPAPAVFTYGIQVDSMLGGSSLWKTSFASTVTRPVAYGGMPLNMGANYRWSLYVYDPFGNSSTAIVKFTP